MNTYGTNMTYLDSYIIFRFYRMQVIIDGYPVKHMNYLFTKETVSEIANANKIIATNKRT